MCFFLVGCSFADEIIEEIDLPRDRPELISSIKVTQFPAEIKSEESYYGTITIQNFEITNYNSSNSSDLILINYQLEAYSDNKECDYLAFYFVFYDKDGFRVGDRWFMENAENAEKIKIIDDMYIPKTTVEIKLLPAD